MYILAVLNNLVLSAPILAQAASGESSNDPVTGWVTGGSAVIAVGALAFIARQFASGRLISSDSADTIKRLEEHVVVQQELTAKVVALAERSERREEVLMQNISRALDGRGYDPHGTD